MVDHTSYHALTLRCLLSATILIFQLCQAQLDQCDIAQDNLIVDWSDVFSGSDDTLFYEIDVTQLQHSIGSNENNDHDDEILNVAIMSDYKVVGKYSSASQDTQFGITYVIDTKPFGYGLLQHCNPCENRQNSSYYNQSFIDDFWTYTLNPASEIGNDDFGLEYPNPNIWDVSMNDSINDPCGVVKWEHNFTLSELYNDCGFIFRETNESIILNGGFYLTLLSPISMFIESCDNGETDCGQYYSTLLLHESIELVLQRSVTVISNPVYIEAYTTLLNIVEDKDKIVRRLTDTSSSNGDSGDYTIITLKTDILTGVNKDVIIDSSSLVVSFTPITDEDDKDYDYVENSVPAFYESEGEISVSCAIIDNDSCYQRVTIWLSLYFAKNCTEKVSPSFDITGLFSLTANVKQNGNHNGLDTDVFEVNIDPVEIGYVGLFDECCNSNNINNKSDIDKKIELMLSTSGPYVYLYTGSEYDLHHKHKTASFRTQSVLFGIFVKNSSAMNDFTNAALLYDVAGRDKSSVTYNQLSRSTTFFMLPVVYFPDNKTLVTLGNHLKEEGIINEVSDLSNMSYITVYGVVYVTIKTTFNQSCDASYHYSSNGTSFGNVLTTKYDQLVSINDKPASSDELWFTKSGMVKWNIYLSFDNDNSSDSNGSKTNASWSMKKVWNLILIPGIIAVFVIGLVAVVCFCSRQSNVVDHNGYDIAGDKQSKSYFCHKNENKNKNTNRNDRKRGTTKTARNKTKITQNEDGHVIDLTEAKEQKIMLAKASNDSDDEQENNQA